MKNLILSLLVLLPIQISVPECPQGSVMNAECLQEAANRRSQRIAEENQRFSLEMSGVEGGYYADLQECAADTMECLNSGLGTFTTCGMLLQRCTQHAEELLAKSTLSATHRHTKNLKNIEDQFQAEALDCCEEE